uniref:MYND-type domain-containing protein n=1 Tax=Haemonchus contortus TaxID=6289 RepID=A0A7I4XXW5_HAECO
MLRIVPNQISDERIDTITHRGKRGRKPKAKVNKLECSYCRGAVIESRDCKGHLQYECKDGCLKEACFGDLKDIMFPGAFAKEPLGSLWRAWVAASIFIRNDMNTAEKIKAWKKGVICLDAEALQRVLRLAYDRCKDWTEFLYVTDGISKHERIDDYCFDRTYDEALKSLKRDLDEQEKNRRSKKQGPTAFAAPENALLLERDGSRRGIIAKVATSFEKLRDVLDELKACSTWIIVWPLDTHFTDAQICETLRRCHQQLEEGGRIVSVFPPLMESNQATWRQLTELWQMIEGALQKKAGPSQFLSTASHKIEGGKVFVEAGAPEGCLNFYGKNLGVGCAKALYECIRNSLKEAHLPELNPLEVAPTRAPAPRGGRMWITRSRGREREGLPPPPEIKRARGSL